MGRIPTCAASTAPPGHAGNTLRWTPPNRPRSALSAGLVAALAETSKREPAGGARCSRRFTPHTVLSVRPAFVRRTLKRPEGRAPSVFHASSLDFRSRRSGVVRPRGMTLGGSWTRGPKSGRPHSHSAAFRPTRFQLLHPGRCAARNTPLPDQGDHGVFGRRRWRPGDAGCVRRGGAFHLGR